MLRRVAAVQLDTISVLARSHELVAYSRLGPVGKQQVEQIGASLQNAADIAKTRLEKIDTAVDNTVEQVEDVGAAMKKAVMRPVREVNGLAAGISAAVSTLVRVQRKYSVDHATQDEEMFI